MNATRSAQFEQTLLTERKRLQEVLDRLSVPPTDAAGEHIPGTRHCRKHANE